MEKGKDTKKLNAEELEKRVAPVTLYTDPADPTYDNPTGTASDPVVEDTKPGKGPKPKI